jgi:hypothetical protein
MTTRKQNTKQAPVVTAAVPGQRLGWLKSELDAAGLPYKVERAGDGYHVHTHVQAAPVVDGVLGYKAKGPRKLPLLQRIKAIAQKLIYFVQDLIVYAVIVAALLVGVRIYGLGDLDPSFALLVGDVDGPLLRVFVFLVVAVVVLFALNRKVGKPAGGMPAGVMTHRFLSVLLIGALVVALLMAWAGRL